jgi:hypothetical protein
MPRTRVCLKNLFLFSILLVSTAGLCALGGQDRGEKPKTVQVTGRVRLIGSGYSTELVISGADREWRIDEKDKQKLMDLQQQIVTVKGKETSKEMTFANGTSAGTWYYLRDIKIIK